MAYVSNRLQSGDGGGCEVNPLTTAEMARIKADLALDVKGLGYLTLMPNDMCVPFGRPHAHKHWMDERLRQKNSYWLDKQ